METATHGRLAQDSPKPLSERRFGLAFALWFLVLHDETNDILAERMAKEMEPLLDERH